MAGVCVDGWSRAFAIRTNVLTSHTTDGEQVDFLNPFVPAVISAATLHNVGIWRLHALDRPLT